MEDLELKTMKSPEHRQRAAIRKLHRLVDVLPILPEFILNCGITLAWYIRYTHFHYSSLLTVGVCGLTIIVISTFLHCYYLNCRSSLLSMFYHLWLGCLLGLIALLDINVIMEHRLSEWENVANSILSTSVICQLGVCLLTRCCRSTTASEQKVWSRAELCELLGALVACLITAPSNTVGSLVLLTLAFSMALTAVRLGSLLSMINLMLLLFTCERYLLPDLHLSLNPYGLIVLVSRLSLQPLFDLFLGGIIRLDRWCPLLECSSFCHRLLLCTTVILQMFFLLSHARAVRQHKEWYVVVPLFIICSIAWMGMHIIFAIILGSLINRLASTRSSCPDALDLKKALAASGLRYFSLVAQKLICVCTLTTVSLGLLCWTTRNQYNFSLFVIVLAVELMIVELLGEFSGTLGGTCIGYGIIAPIVSTRSVSSMTILPPNFIQETGARSNRILRMVTDFFTEHLITNYDCDWSMTGLSMTGFEKKMSSFFQQTTPEGVRYDTYLFYYSGPTTLMGDWAMTGGDALSLNDLLEIWRDANSTFDANKTQCRLLLFCDCTHSDQWLLPIGQLANDKDFVALQTSRWSTTNDDPESCSSIGDLTAFWMEFNSTEVKNGNKQMPTNKPNYAVSRHWIDFEPSPPSAEQMLSYWLRIAPHPLLVCLRVVSTRSPCCLLCERCTRLIRRSRMRFCLPYELDTGHGFKLIRCL